MSLVLHGDIAVNLRDLHSELDFLHAHGDFTSARHQALCEAIAITGRALAILESHVGRSHVR